MEGESAWWCRWRTKLKNIWQAGRKQPFDRKEQLSVVKAFHFVILAFVLGIFSVSSIFSASGMAPWPPTGFIVCETLIIFGCAAVGYEDGPLRRAVMRFAGKKERTPGQQRVTLENVQGKVLLAASALQFVALWPLIIETGGPIESPFTQMAIVFAIFTPFIANRWMTSIAVLLITILYYAALVFAGQWSELDAAPPRGVYFAVNVMILVFAVALTVVDLQVRDRPSDTDDDLGVDGATGA
jgi:hypothetical protein